MNGDSNICYSEKRITNKRRNDTNVAQLELKSQRIKEIAQVCVFFIFDFSLFFNINGFRHPEQNVSRAHIDRSTSVKSLEN